MNNNDVLNELYKLMKVCNLNTYVKLDIKKRIIINKTEIKILKTRIKYLQNEINKMEDITFNIKIKNQ